MKRIVVAIDESKPALAAVRMAGQIAIGLGLGEVTVLHVFTALPTPSGEMKYPFSPDRPQDWPVFEKPQQILRELHVTPKLEIRGGDAAHEIIVRAKEGDFDLIVVGNRGLSPVKAFLIGSVSSRLASHAHCSVLVVKEDEKAETPAVRDAQPVEEI